MQRVVASCRPRRCGIDRTGSCELEFRADACGFPDEHAKAEPRVLRLRVRAPDEASKKQHCQCFPHSRSLSVMCLNTLGSSHGERERAQLGLSVTVLVWMTINGLDSSWESSFCTCIVLGLPPGTSTMACPSPQRPYPNAVSNSRWRPTRSSRSLAKRCTPAKIDSASRCASAITSGSRPPVSH